MMSFRYLSLSIIFTTSIIALSNAANAAAIPVTCTTNNPNAISIALATALSTAKLGAYLQFNVTGNCVDYIYIPQGVSASITGSGSGAYGASLSASTSSQPAIAVNGQLTLTGFSVTSSYSTDSVLKVGTGGWLGIYNSSISSNTTNNAVHATNGGTLTIENSIITGAQNSAVEIGQDAYAWIDATNNSSTVISYTGNGGQAIGCWQSVLGIGTTGHGKVTIGPSSAQGISARGCRATIGNSSMLQNSVIITGAVQAGIRAKNSDSISLVGAYMHDNPNISIEVSAGTVELDTSTINVPTNGTGLLAQRDGTIYFNHINGNGINNVTGTNPYSCYQNGHIYADAAYPPSGGASSAGCLIIGGSTTH